MLYDDGELTYSVDENVSLTLSLALVQRIVLNSIHVFVQEHCPLCRYIIISENIIR